MKDKLGEARSSMRSLKENNESLHDLLAKVQDDKRRLGIRVNKLINNGNFKTSKMECFADKIQINSLARVSSGPFLTKVCYFHLNIPGFVAISALHFQLIHMLLIQNNSGQSATRI